MCKEKFEDVAKEIVDRGWAESEDDIDSEAYQAALDTMCIQCMKERKESIQMMCALYAYYKTMRNKRSNQIEELNNEESFSILAMALAEAILGNTNEAVPNTRSG